MYNLCGEIGRASKQRPETSNIRFAQRNPVSGVCIDL